LRLAAAAEARFQLALIEAVDMTQESIANCELPQEWLVAGRIDHIAVGLAAIR
jgi:hypothetical protein